MELSAQLEDMQESERQSAETSGSEAADLRRKFAELTQRHGSLETESRKWKTQAEEMDPKLTSALTKVGGIVGEILGAKRNQWGMSPVGHYWNYYPGNLF